jgi:hypothetical protein
MSEEVPPPIDDEDDLSGRVGLPGDIRLLRTRLLEIKAKWPKPGPKMPADQMTALRRLQMRYARMMQRTERFRPKGGPSLRLVRAVEAERSAGRAIDEAAKMIEEKARNLRLAIGTYAVIARTDLPKRLTEHLADEDKKVSMQAAALLTQIFVHITSELRDRKQAGKSAMPGWPSEGSKG